MAQIEWYIREYICRNGVCEKTKFPLVSGGDSSAYAGRDRKRRLRSAEKNATEAKTEAARSVNNNFAAGRDYLLTATYSDEGLEGLIARTGTDDPDALLLQMRKDLQNWIRRAKRRMNAAERDSGDGSSVPGGTARTVPLSPRGASHAELKYMAFPAGLDGKRLTPARPHLHVIVNAEGMEALAKAWHGGYVYGTEKKLYAAHHGDLTDLVEYLMSQCRTVGTEKRYVPSRNLEKPEASRLRPAKNPDAPLAIPKDAKLILKSEQRAGRPQKIRYYRESKDRTRVNTAEDRGDGINKGTAGTVLLSPAGQQEPSPCPRPEAPDEKCKGVELDKNGAHV